MAMNIHREICGAVMGGGVSLESDQVHELAEIILIFTTENMPLYLLVSFLIVCKHIEHSLMCSKKLLLYGTYIFYMTFLAAKYICLSQSYKILYF